MTRTHRLTGAEGTTAPAASPVLRDGLRGVEASAHTLELVGVLQTTLDLTELLDLFLREVQADLELDGLRFGHPARGIEVLRGTASRHSAAYKLTVNGQHLGEMEFFRAFPFGGGDLRSLEDLMVALLYPLRNSLAYREALLSALVDPLTGVNNRAAMDMVLKREVELARRQGTPLSVILLDIDFFKRINDAYGHPTGDLCLQAVARCVQDSVRGSDLVFRCGGEEFLALLSHTELEGAGRLAERIRRNVAALPVPSLRERGLSVSLGVAALGPDDSVASLYQRADAAMYRAKETGRNRVAVS
jgi:diguanylate cyclase (GGDEF)-like protein